MITEVNVENTFDRSHPDPKKWFVSERALTLTTVMTVEEYERVAVALDGYVRNGRSSEAAADLFAALQGVMSSRWAREKKRGEAREDGG